MKQNAQKANPSLGRLNSNQTAQHPMTNNWTSMYEKNE